MDKAVAGNGISVPVFLHDGERETYVGTAVVHPFLKFHDLQSGICQRVGVPPHQISIYSAERRSCRSWPRKTQVNARFDFRSITGTDGVYFLVFLRRQGPRERPPRGGGGGASAGNRPPPENPMLLRRGTLPAGYMDPTVDAYEWERRMTMVLAEMEMEKTRNLPRHCDTAGGGGGGGGGYVFCEECEKIKGSRPETEFHLCPIDAVAVGHRVGAGPVARPAKR